VINIRPAVSVYATYRRLSYRTWGAVAEFVDNSTQNYYDHRKDLLRVYRREGNPGKLRIEAVYDGDRNVLTILDNANGMNLEELERAVVLDRPPPNRSGRCEYGMGLKTAACWFGTTWTIKTTRMGSSREYSVRVHVPQLVKEHLEEVPIEEKVTSRDSHFTLITIEGVYKPIRGRTSGRVRDHLGSMYRVDLRSGEIEILWNGEPLSFAEPPILVEAVDGVQVQWKKEVQFEVAWVDGSTDLPVRGWVGIRLPGSQRDAGFALLRRGRVVVGGPGEGYKPAEIFGQGNTFRSQRLIGELNLDQWPVTQAKDAFDWSGGLEDEFIEHLKRAAQDYMDKAEAFRQPGRSITQADMELASEGFKTALEQREVGRAIAQEIALPEPPRSREQEARDTAKLLSLSSGPVVYHVPVGEADWVFRLHWQDRLSEAHWMSVSFPDDYTTDIFLNMAHPFFVRYLEDRGFLELLQRFVVALALAERMARQVHHGCLIDPSDLRNYMNRVLLHVSESEGERGT